MYRSPLSRTGCGAPPGDWDYSFPAPFPVRFSFDLALAKENVRKVHPGAEILDVSSTTGAGFTDWLSWLDSKRKACAGRRADLVTS